MSRIESDSAEASTSIIPENLSRAVHGKWNESKSNGGVGDLVKVLSPWTHREKIIYRVDNIHQRHVLFNQSLF